MAAFAIPVLLHPRVEVRDAYSGYDDFTAANHASCNPYILCDATGIGEFDGHYWLATSARSWAAMPARTGTLEL
jgi:hypothetical protein